MRCPEVETRKMSLSKVIKRWNVREEKANFVLHIPPARPSCPEVPEETMQRAQGLITEAQAQAREILHRAYEEGRQKGYREGFARGLTEGKEKGLNQLADAYRQALQVLDQAENFRVNTTKELEPEIVKLAVAMAEKIIFAKLAKDGEAIVSIVRQGIKQLAAPKQINIFVHPSDGEKLLAQQRILQAEVPDSVPLKIIVKNDLAPGSCLIETDKGTVDASVQTQIKELKKTLEIA
ncbi:MAG: FliH/SctL family protein [Bacillota bacterium]|nr:hypothetical protein [Clostridia bacterium]